MCWFAGTGFDPATGNVENGLRKNDVGYDPVTGTANQASSSSNGTLGGNKDSIPGNFPSNMYAMMIACTLQSILVWVLVMQARGFVNMQLRVQLKRLLQLGQQHHSATLATLVLILAWLEARLSLGDHKESSAYFSWLKSNRVHVICQTVLMAIIDSLYECHTCTGSIVFHFIVFHFIV